ncbi:MAG TPA: tetratricopeptide repeat protein [Chthoniobacterales bacterium]|nr:tetratricopeptide repeat protein [Chthoniobacterales bacterium]
MLAVWLVFGQTLQYDFVNYDDPSYVYENPNVSKGLTVGGVEWAFTHSHARNWHPLTTLSHMLDCQLFGMRAGGHHAINILLHALAVILLFLVLRQMTGRWQRSAFVAGLFAIHPLRVESVAWIAERKDVLSGVFFMLTLGAYVRYVHRRSTGRYLTVVLVFVLGLMSKPMLVTLPFVLLLLDYWPLQRIGQLASSKTAGKSFSPASRLRALMPLLLEKLPLFVLSAASSLVTFLVQKTGGAQADPMPLVWRANNALIGCLTYLRQMVWPVKLAPFYPHLEGGLPVWEPALGLIFLLTITITVWVQRRTNAYLVTGWFWYLGMLVPVLGLVQVGAAGWADRYTYLSQIGLYLCLSWGMADLSARLPQRRAIPGMGAVLVIGTLAWVARIQTAHWRNSESLWTHTLAVTTESGVAHNNLGEVLYQRGQIDEALAHYEKALQIRSREQTSRYDFLLALTHANIGAALQRKGLLDEAIGHYQKATELQPDYAEGYLGLGGALAAKGQLDDAIVLLQKAVMIRPDFAAAYADLGSMFLAKHQDLEAIASYEKTLELAPRSLASLNNLAWLFATNPNPSIRNGQKALALAEQAVLISGGADPFYLHKLAAAYAATGRFSEALETAQRALQLATDHGNSALAGELRRNISVYLTNNPLTDTRR